MFLSATVCRQCDIGRRPLPRKFAELRIAVDSRPFAELAKQPGSSISPVAVRRSDWYSQEFSGLLDRETREAVQFDQFGDLGLRLR